MKSEECIMSLRKLFLNYFFIIKISCAPWVLRRDLRLRLRLSRRSSEYLNLRLIFYEMLVCKHVSIGMNGIGKLAWRMTYRLMKTIVGHDFIKSIIYGEDNYQLSIVRSALPLLQSVATKRIINYQLNTHLCISPPPPAHYTPASPSRGKPHPDHPPSARS